MATIGRFAGSKLDGATIFEGTGSETMGLDGRLRGEGATGREAASSLLMVDSGVGFGFTTEDDAPARPSNQGPTISPFTSRISRLRACPWRSARLTAVGCPDENSLLEFIEGRLDDSRKAALEAHLAECAVCRQLVEPETRDARPRPRNKPLRLERTQLSDPLIGQRVGPWLIGPRLGAGGMGIVYEAVHAQTGQAAAFKLVRGHIAEVPSLLKRFQRETELVQQLDHPNIVKVLDVGSFANKEPYCVLELLKGQPLSSYRKQKGRLEPREVIELLIQLMSALEAAHRAQIVHRDLKPSNLFLRQTPEGTQLTVLDFGLAKSLASTHETAISSQGLLGTPEYMAPEQIRAQASTPAIDLYATGVLTWELLVGERPFDAASPTEVIVRQLEFQPPRASQFVTVPVPLDELVDELMQKDPARRPESAAVVKRRLLEMRATTLLDEPALRRATTALEQPVSVPPPRLTTLEHRAARRSPASAIALGLAVGGLVSAAGIWTFRNRVDQEALVALTPVTAPEPPIKHVEPVVPAPVPPVEAVVVPPLPVPRPQPKAKALSTRPATATVVASGEWLRERIGKLRACVPRLPEQNRAMSSAMLDECERLSRNGEASRAEVMELLSQTERVYFAGVCP